jgi:hypothetical protein
MAVRLGLTTSEGVDHQQVITVPEDLASALQTFVDRLSAEAILAFGESGSQLVLAQWAQKTLAQADAFDGKMIQRRSKEAPQKLKNYG